ncbi:MAG: DUF1854 domain-containing protein [Candidatus Cohnella colombiensis]|uniref:DUF1854 domain-containing protein n=1 Tax=Candidatus Cohnella colombiensis TaxID=3121368 RepID=A0AA95F133_9BACL|nr:MAG: DUF1854 domain-containing protein [Cohnella sp.]
MNEQTSMHWLNPHEMTFYRDEYDFICAQWKGKQERVKVSHLFPMTHPESWISVCSLQGEEWGIIQQLSTLDSISSTHLKRELQMSPYLPRIERIMMIRRRFNHFQWDVATDFGQFSFTTGPIYEAVLRLENGTKVITDVEDQKYIVANNFTLDPISGKLLARWL